MAWLAIGAGFALATAAAPSFGFFLMPFVLAAVLLGVIKLSVWPESIGALTGAAALGVLLALPTRQPSPCPSEGLRLSPGRPRMIECGEAIPVEVFIAASGLLVCSLVTYLLVARRQSAGEAPLRNIAGNDVRRR